MEKELQYIVTSGLALQFKRWFGDIVTASPVSFWNVIFFKKKIISYTLFVFYWLSRPGTSVTNLIDLDSGNNNSSANY